MDAKDFLLRHGEKVALAVVGLIVAVGLMGMMGGSHEEADEINVIVERVEVGINRPVPPTPGLLHAEEIQKRWPESVSAKPLRKWGMHKRYYIVRELEKTPEIERDPPPVHRAPTLGVRERGIDFLLLEFATTVENAEVIKLEVFRTMRADRSGKPEFAGEPYAVLDPGATTFRDEEGIRPRAKIFYKIRSHAKATGTELLPADQRILESDVVLVKVPADVYLIPINVTPGHGIKKIPAKAYIEVVKWFPKESRWRSKPFMVTEKEDIGEMAQGIAPINFRSGFKLLAAEIREVMIPVPGRKPQKKKVFWIKVQETDNPDAGPEEIESSRDYRKMLEGLKKSKKLIPDPPEGPPGEESEDETGSK